MLDPFVRGDKESFKAHNVAEAQRLAGAAFGEAMLTTIGCVPHISCATSPASCSATNSTAAYVCAMALMDEAGDEGSEVS